MKLKVGILLFLACIVGWYTCNFALLLAHEGTHQQIFQSYGIKSESTLKSFYTTGSTRPDTMEGCDGPCLFAHNLNDILGYNLSAFVYILWFIMFVLLLFGERRHREMRPKQ